MNGGDIWNDRSKMVWPVGDDMDRKPCLLTTYFDYLTCIHYCLNNLSTLRVSLKGLEGIDEGVQVFFFVTREYTSIKRKKQDIALDNTIIYDENFVGDILVEFMPKKVCLQSCYGFNMILANRSKNSEPIQAGRFNLQA
ncbi:hypothetical protein ACJX0J_030097 [Zea mays]